MKDKVRCAKAGCGQIKNHPIHAGSGYEHDYQKPARKVRRAAMAAHSEKMQEYYDEVRIPAVAAIQGSHCEAGLLWAGCTGRATDIHEIVSRKQAGSLPLAVELGTMNVCRPCHNWITDNPKEAHEMGYHMSRKDLGLDIQP